MLIEKVFDMKNGNSWNIVVNRNLQDWEVEEHENMLSFLEPIRLNNMYDKLI